MKLSGSGGRGAGAGLARDRFGIEATIEALLPDVRHGFTHFGLTTRPAVLPVQRVDLHAQAPGAMWLNLEETLDAALPAPVRGILRGLALDASVSTTIRTTEAQRTQRKGGSGV